MGETAVRLTWENGMPDDRFIHRTLGHSQKIGRLDDFEYRVWTQYELSSDDFGIMPLEASVLKSDNIRFRRESDDRLNGALRCLVDVGLVLQFQHQEQEYVCDPRWQDFQKVRWPRKTIHPCPPADVLKKFSEETMKLFRKHHVGFPKGFKIMQTDEADRSLAMANAMAMAKDKEGGKEDRIPGALLTAYHDRFLAKFGEKPHIGKGKDAKLAQQLLAQYPLERLCGWLDRFFADPDPFFKRSGYAFGVFASCLNKFIANGPGGKKLGINEKWARRKP